MYFRTHLNRAGHVDNLSALGYPDETILSLLNMPWLFKRCLLGHDDHALSHVLYVLKFTHLGIWTYGIRWDGFS